MRADQYHYRGGKNVPGQCMYCGGKQYGSPLRGAMHICSACSDLRMEERAIAHRAVKKAIEQGLLPPIESQYCLDCGGFASLYDHRSYHEVLKVDPVCHRCNQLRGPGFWDRDLCLLEARRA